MRSLRLWLFAAPIVVSGACGACSNDVPDAGVDSGSPDAAVDALDSMKSCTPAPRPSYVPADWISYDDYAPCSGLYVPTTPAALPTPIAWQACEAAANVAGCRRIALDWASPSDVPSELYMGADVALDKNGNAVILTSRDYGAVLDHRIELLADADGPVHSAIMATQVAEHLLVGFLPPSFTASRWLVRVFDGTSWGGGGYVGGTPGVVAPTVHSKFGSVATHYAVAGDLGVLDIASNAAIGLFDFNTGSKILDIKKSSLPMSFAWMFRDQVYWQGNSNLVDDVGRWTADAGSIDFINYGFDPNHGTADLGTDGTDMVWFEETGIDDAGAHAAMAYWTSPYVTDRAKVQPRRLRSEIPNTNVGTPIAVGCGYAAFGGPAFISGLRIVRLSDGWSWFLPNNPSWYWTQALALTCSEVFASIHIAGPITTMARVALNQLGAGVPPD